MSGPRIQTVTSPSGIEAWLVEDHNLPLMAIEFAFMDGASQDPPGQAGALNLIAGLLDEGAGDMDAEVFQNALADRAIELSFHTERDSFRGTLRALSRHREEAVRLTALALGKPRFDADAVERVKAQVSAGLRREQQDPDSIARNLFMRAAFPGHPYGEPTRGTLESVAAIQPAHLAAVAASLFNRSRLKVVAVGDISPGELAEALDAIFGGLPAVSALPVISPAAISGLGRIEIVEMDVPQTALRYGAPAFGREDPDFIAAEVVNHILGGSAFTSRLFMEVREKRGLAYGVSSGLVPLRQTAYHVGATATKNDRVAESLEVMRAEMRALASEGPTEQELADAKDYLIGSFPLRFDTSGKIASQLLTFALHDLGVDYVARRNDLFRAVGMKEARRAAERLYGAGDLLVVAVGKPVGLS